MRFSPEGADHQHQTKHAHIMEHHNNETNTRLEELLLALLDEVQASNATQRRIAHALTVGLDLKRVNGRYVKGDDEL